MFQTHTKHARTPISVLGYADANRTTAVCLVAGEQMTAAVTDIEGELPADLQIITQPLSLPPKLPEAARELIERPAVLPAGVPAPVELPPPAPYAAAGSSADAPASPVNIDLPPPASAPVQNGHPVVTVAGQTVVCEKLVYSEASSAPSGEISTPEERAAFAAGKDVRTEMLPPTAPPVQVSVAAAPPSPPAKTMPAKIKLPATLGRGRPTPVHIFVKGIDAAPRQNRTASEALTLAHEHGDNVMISGKSESSAASSPWVPASQFFSELMAAKKKAAKKKAAK